MNQPFRNFCAVLALVALTSPLFAQQAQKARSSQPKPKSAVPQKKAASVKPTPEPVQKIDSATEKERFELAIAAGSAAEKAELLVKFIADFPKSELKLRAEESLAGARAAIADERLTAGDISGALKLFKLVVETAPKPYSERLFTGIIATIPANLYLRGHRAEGLELARLIESNVATDARQLLLLTTFYLGTENGDDAKRLAETAIALDEKNSAAHQTLASAFRLNFDIESAEVSFAKAVELDPDSTIARRSLADMKRALGKAEQAETIYREILAGNEKDNQARTGLTLALFDLGKRSEAEAEMAKALVEVPGNVVLLASAAYWYASNKDGEKAVEYARRAIEKEPRYIWSHIALGRGLMVQGKPVDAEQVLLAARKYGNFPTLQYEIASARLAAGFFREAVEELRESFSIVDGKVRTRLGGRIDSSADSFAEAIAAERNASIMAPNGAYSSDGPQQLKALLELTDRLGSENKDEAAIVDATDRFASGTDNMSVHRKLYAAQLLLQNSIATEKAMTLAGEAVGGLDHALDVASPGAAVMANELYEARNVSFARNDFLLIPEVPRQTLVSLMRGKVEEVTGLALLQQGKAEEASIRFKRALSVLPKDSAWWRSATWNLGTSLAAEGKDTEALETMISSFSIDKPDLARYLKIESLWIKVNGTREGLQEKIGPNPLPDFSATAKVEASPSPSLAAEDSNAAEKADTSPQSSEAIGVKAESSPLPEAVSSPRVDPETTASPKPSGAEVNATPSPETVSTEPASSPSPKPEPAEAEVTQSPTPEPASETTPKPEPIPSSKETQPNPSPSPEALSAEPESEGASKPDKSGTELKPSPKSTPESTPSPAPSTERSAEKQEPVSAVQQASLQQPEKPRSERLSGSIFEPIIISIPNSRPQEKSGSGNLKPEIIADVVPSASPSTSVDEMAGGQARPRIVEGKAIVGELMPCQISVSQETVSLIKNGGSIALLVSMEEGEDIKLLTARSNSPEDLEVRLEPALVEIPGRSMFVVKSVSDRVGLYQVAFSAPCGRAEVIVRVR